MTRLHKYRAFIDGQMVYFGPLTLTEGHQEIAAPQLPHDPAKFWIDDHFPEPADLMQWTGKTDRYGRDIYENDIIQIDEHDFSPMQFIVKWSETNSSWWFVSVEHSIYDGFESPKEWFSFADLNGFQEDSTVLGNALENPELLVGPTPSP